MYQLTSGSTGTPKAVELTHANHPGQLERPCSRRSDGDATTDVMVSWLPLSTRHGHARDSSRCPMQLWRRAGRRPGPRSSCAARRCGRSLISSLPRNHHRRGRTSPTRCSPRALERAAPRRASTCPALRVAINGAEPIDARDIQPTWPGRAFPLRAAPRGRSLPAYGMAEATLGHHASTPRRRVVNVDRDQSVSDLQERALAHAGRRSGRVRGGLGRSPGGRHGGSRRRRSIPAVSAASRRVDRGSRCGGVPWIPHRARVARGGHP